jgi:tripartite-type tricarboxylate transporter receptor subunit TctC
MINLSKRKTLLYSSLALLPSMGWSQIENNLKISVGFPPGGSGDLFARILAEALHTELGRAVVVENKPGGGGMTVASTFLRAPKDGSQLMLATGSTAISAPISRLKPPYNPVEDFQWIALLSHAPFVIAINPNIPATNLKEFIAYVKANPKKLSYGHAGLGTTVHLAAELFKDKAGVDILDIAYSGSVGAINDTIAGNVHMIVETTGTLLPYHKSGRMRIIACMSANREKISPDIPTTLESGFDIVAGTSNLLAMPLGTPPALIEPISKALSRVMEKPSVQEKLTQLGIQVISQSSPAMASEYVASEIARWTPIVKKLNIAL